MECHCKDHLPGEWHSHEECDCHRHENPTYTFVVTKVMSSREGGGTVFISKQFMELLTLQDGDPVEILSTPECIVQAKSHPNSWMDARMISVDQDTMDRLGLAIFGQVKLRKASCCDAHSIVVRVPDTISVSRVNLRGMIDKLRGTVLHGLRTLTLVTDRKEEIKLDLVRVDPSDVSRLGKATAIMFVDPQGEDYISRKDTAFKDVGGLDDAISGTGKTLIARAVAGETGCYFKSIIGTEIMDKYYGESEAKLRAAFEEAHENAPAIIFIDEIDALAPKRETSEGEVERRVTAQLLALMDGLEDRGSLMVLAATNLPNSLDPALRRPGRFDREILIGVPDSTGRREILDIHTRDMPLGQVNLDELAEKTHGFVGADLKAVCREASFQALRRVLPGLENTDQTLSHDFLDAVKVEQEDFLTALGEMRPSSGRAFEVDLSGSGWDRIAGYESEIEFLQDLVIWPIKHDRLLSGIGLNTVAGLLITGPSGVGKTLMAKSLAKESGLNVIEITGTELLSKYMGESEKNIREMFKQARQMAPTVLVLDGVDALNSSGWTDSKVLERIANQLAKEMNANSGDRPVVVVATASRSENVPPILRATGRFSHELRLHLPTSSDRLAMFKMWLNAGCLRFPGDYSVLCKESEGLSGGEINDVCQRAFLQKARHVIEHLAEPPDEIPIQSDDVIKVLDRWKLTHRKDHPAS